MLIYSWFIFDDKKLKIIETVISVIAIVGLTILVVVKPKNTYNTQFTIYGIELREDTKAWLEDEKYGKLNMKYEEGLEEYMIEANFTDTGSTKVYVQTDDKKCEANIRIERYSYEITDTKCD